MAVGQGKTSCHVSKSTKAVFICILLGWVWFSTSETEKSIRKDATIWTQLTFIVMHVGRTCFCGCSFLCMFSRWEVHVQLKHRGWPLVQTKQNTHTAAANARERLGMVSCQGNTAPGEGRGWSKHLPYSDLWGITLTESRWASLKQRERVWTSEEEEEKLGENASICPMRRVEFIYYQEEEVVPWGGLINVQPSILSVRFCLLKGKQSTGGWEKERERERERRGVVEGCSVNGCHWGFFSCRLGPSALIDGSDNDWTDP